MCTHLRTNQGRSITSIKSIPLFMLDFLSFWTKSQGKSKKFRFVTNSKTFAHFGYHFFLNIWLRTTMFNRRGVKKFKEKIYIMDKTFPHFSIWITLTANKFINSEIFSCTVFLFWKDLINQTSKGASQYCLQVQGSTQK